MIKRVFSMSKLNIYLKNYTPLIKFGLKVSPNHIVNLIKKISKNIFIKNCLVISICIYKTLKSFNLNSVIVVGVNKENNIFYSHAWIEIDDFIIFDREKKDFNEIFRIS